MRVFLGVLLAIALVPFGAKAAEEAVFDIRLGGVKAAVLAMNGAEGNGRYSAKSALTTTGLVGSVVKVTYRASVSGIVRRGRYVPGEYRENADTGRRASSAIMRYRAGVPQVKEYAPVREAEPYDLDPAMQGGTVDPMTALWALLRDRSRADLCSAPLDTFDGRRRGRITFEAPEMSENGAICRGLYQRVKGFDPKDLAERRRFPFRLFYEPAGNGEFRVRRAELTTLYGQAVMDRR